MGTGILTLSGSNTYTGNTTISAGTLLLGNPGSMTFAVGANGVNNMITGTGFLTLQGTFVFDLTGAAIVDGNSWMLVDVGTLLAATYDPSFAVSGFTESSDVWTKVDGSNTWTFTESTGVLDLSVVPEPGSLLLVAGGLMFFMISRRRAARI